MNVLRSNTDVQLPLSNSTTSDRMVATMGSVAVTTTTHSTPGLHIRQAGAEHSQVEDQGSTREMIKKISFTQTLSPATHNRSIMKGIVFSVYKVLLREFAKTVMCHCFLGISTLSKHKNNADILWN